MEQRNKDAANQMNYEQKNVFEIIRRSIRRLLEWKFMYGVSFSSAFLGMCLDSVANVVKNAYWFQRVAYVVVFCIVVSILLSTLAYGRRSISDRLKNALQEFSRFGLCMACVVAGGLAALCVSSVRSHIDKETTDYVYCENVIDNYGMFKVAGKQSNTPISGWYRFTYKGTHSINEKHIHRYDANKRPYGFLPWRYRTLHSVELIDGAKHTLPPALCADIPPARIIYKYRQDGLDVETWEFSMLDAVLDNGFNLEFVQKWYDSGDNINVECRMVDGKNRRVFAPSSSTASWNEMVPLDVVLPHSKFSSYKVVRDGLGRMSSVLTSVPDHDGIKRVDFEYADNDEYELPYLRREMYNTINADGIQQIEKEYNGTSIDLRYTGDSRFDIRIDAISRNENAWTNMVVSHYSNGIGNTNYVIRYMRKIDDLGRVVNDEIFRRTESGEVRLAENRYCWTVMNEVNVVSDIEYRDGEGNLIERPFLPLSDVFGASSTNMPMAARIRYVQGKGHVDVMLFDATGTNVTDRIRFYGENNGRERIEWRSHDGVGVVPIGIWKDSVAVAWESISYQDKVGVAKPNNAGRLQCMEVRWLSASGDLAQCPAGWAVRRIYTNPDCNDDVEDIGFSEQVRRIEYLGTDGKLCRTLGLAPIQEFAHDKSGRVVEIRNQDADGMPLATIVTQNGGMPISACIKIIYDNFGRVTRRLYLDEKGAPCEQSELVFAYNGTSRIASKVEMVGRSGSRVDVTKNLFLFREDVSPQFKLPVGTGPIGQEVEEPD